MTTTNTADDRRRRPVSASAPETRIGDPRVFVDGGWRSTEEGATRVVIDPSTGNAIGEAAIGTAADVAAVVAAARRALPAWRELGGEGRADALDRLAAVWERRGAEYAALVSREMGMPIALSSFLNGVAPVMMFRSYARQARELEVEQTRTPALFEGRVLVREEPAGVVAAIAPWNFVGPLSGSKLAPALAAGCTVVFKPAEENALSSALIGGFAEEAGLPDGVLNVVPGGASFAAELVAHPGVDRIAFTGSTAVGRAIGATAGERLASVNLELGGKSAAIVLDDADLDLVGTELAELAFMNAGQTCFAQTRIVATPGVYDDVVERLTAYAQRQVLGGPFDPSTTMGPLGTRLQKERATALVEGAIAQGARLVAGGPQASVPVQGTFFAPTVLADVDNSWEIARTEIFAPVVVVIRAADADDALALANDSPYDLAGSVWTRDVEAGIELAHRLEAGTRGVNGYAPDLSAPWGGLKASGLGRENGPEALKSYLVPRATYVFARTETGA